MPTSKHVYLLEELPSTILGESPWCNCTSGRLHYVDMIKDEIHRHDFATKTHDIMLIDSTVGFVVLDSQGRIVAGLRDGIYRDSFGDTKK